LDGNGMVTVIMPQLTRRARANWRLICAAVSRRTLVYIGIAIALLVGGRLLSSSNGAPKLDEAPLEPPVPPPSFSVKPPPPPEPFKRPPSSVFEVGVLSDRSKDALEAILDRASLAAALPARLCGDEAPCEAVKKALGDEHTTTLSVVDSSGWSLERLDVDVAARNLTTRERAIVKTLPRVVVVHVNAATSSKQIAIRTGFAVAALVAEKVGGLVWDQLLDRVENAHDFGAHAVTAPLDAPTFRRDRLELQFVPKEEGIVRLLTTGLSRWGVADVEAPTVPTAAAERVGDVVLGVAAAIANGTATASPVTLSRDALAKARGRDYPADPGMPAVADIDVDVTSVHPQNLDPNDFMLRVEPMAGEGPIAYIDLAGRFFGSLLTAAPAADVLAERRDRAQTRLTTAIARWTAGRTAGAKLLVLLPFGIPGEGGTESMWVDVTRADGKSVTGKVIDEPLGATDVHEGDEVTRPRGDVEDLDLRMPTP
jgi:hypothetical protein